jgi:hypothetical protein
MQARDTELVARRAVRGSFFRLLKMGALGQILDSCPDSPPSGFVTLNMQSGLNLGARYKGVVKPTGVGWNRAASGNR